ncbi:MAG: photosystem I protein PsaX [Leptolyngbyaceae bacterium]|nr:photosystem I protein PsaX [Leptolyngbyaceae bacterium]
MPRSKDITPKTSDVIPGLVIFLAINFLVAAMYFHIINP